MKSLPLVRASVIFFIILSAAAITSCATATCQKSEKTKRFNFTAYSDEMGRKYPLTYFNTQKYLSLRPTGGKIIWEDYCLKQRHVASYSSANSRYLLLAFAGGATGIPRTVLYFPLLCSNSGTQCSYYMEIFDTVFINNYEQRLNIYDDQQNKIFHMWIKPSERDEAYKDVFEIKRINPSKEGREYYLITKIVFKKDLVLYGGGKDNKVMKIHKGSYITFQNRSLFKIYRGMFFK